jgi:exportin-7
MHMYLQLPMYLLCISCSVESQEVLDAELSARVLQLINVTDSGLHSQVYRQ